MGDDRINRLRAADQALREAEAVPCTCSGFVLQYEGCGCARSKARKAAAAEHRAALAAVLAGDEGADD